MTERSESRKHSRFSPRSGDPGAAAPDDLREPVAWLTRVVTNAALDRLRSARVRREAYVGTWLPEPEVGPPWPPDPGRGDPPLGDPCERVLLGALRGTDRLDFARRLVNGDPGLVLAHDGGMAVLAFVVRDGRVAQVDVVANPDKLGRISPGPGGPRGRAGSPPPRR